MLDKSFDPKKFIDREFEQELLKSCCNSMTMRASWRLTMQVAWANRNSCKSFNIAAAPRVDRTPVALIDLGQLPDSSPLMLAQQLAKEFAAFSLSFPNFERVEMARLTPMIFQPYARYCRSAPCEHARRTHRNCGRNDHKLLRLTRLHLTQATRPLARNNKQLHKKSVSKHFWKIWCHTVINNGL